MSSNTVVFSESPIVASALGNCLGAVQASSPPQVHTKSEDLIAEVAVRRPEIVFMEFEARHFGLLSEIHRISPKTAIILWVRDLSTELVYEAIHSGVRGIVPRAAAAAEVLASIQRVIKGELCLDQNVSAQLLTMTPVRLSRRESNLLTLISQGLKNKEIATALNLSEGTVRIYLSHLYQKVGAKDRYELALFALKHLALGRRQANGDAHERKQEGQHVIFRAMQ